MHESIKDLLYGPNVLRITRKSRVQRGDVSKFIVPKDLLGIYRQRIVTAVEEEESAHEGEKQPKRGGEIALQNVSLFQN